MRSQVGLSIIGIVSLGLVLWFRVGPGTTNIRDDEATAAIEQLHSADLTIRNAAKEKLVRIGPRAMRPLAMFLEDLIRHPRERYPLGKTEKDLDDLKKRIAAIPEDDPIAKVEAGKQLAALVINQRLREDTCELLGRLHAVEAVPVLIQAMEYEPSDSSWETMNAAMRALIEIGSPAVPEIIEAIETARSRAESTPYADGHPSEFFVKTESAKNQARATMVLGEIKDLRALPVLEWLRNTSDSEWLIPYIERASVSIRERAH